MAETYTWEASKGSLNEEISIGTDNATETGRGTYLQGKSCSVCTSHHPTASIIRRENNVSSKDRWAAIALSTRRLATCMVAC